METKGLKVVWDVKTRRINMLATLNHVEKKYKMLIAKMAIDFNLMEGARGQYVGFVWHWYDLGLVLCFAYVKIY